MCIHLGNTHRTSEAISFDKVIVVYALYLDTFELSLNRIVYVPNNAGQAYIYIAAQRDKVQRGKHYTDQYHKKYASFEKLHTRFLMTR